MVRSRLSPALLLLALAACVLLPSVCLAADNHVGVGPIDSLSKMIVGTAKGWIAPMQGYARGVFVGLAVIQIAWVGIRHALSGDPHLGSAVGAVALEFVTLSFFAILIDRGPGWAEDIVASLQEAGRIASGAGHDVRPQQVLDEVVKLSTNVLEELSLLNAISSGLAMAIGCLLLLVMTALIAGLMLIGWVQAWVVVGAGSILLGFGGSVWTRSLATGYLQHALGAGVKLMVLELLQSLMLGHAKAWVDAAQGGDQFSLELLTTVLVSFVVMVVMIATVPSYVSSIVTGAVMNGGEAALTRAAAAATMLGVGMGMRSGSAASASANPAWKGIGGAADALEGSRAPGLVGAGAPAPGAAASGSGAGGQSAGRASTGESAGARNPGSIGRQAKPNGARSQVRSGAGSAAKASPVTTEGDDADPWSAAQSEGHTDGSGEAPDMAARMGAVARAGQADDASSISQSVAPTMAPSSGPRAPSSLPSAASGAAGHMVNASISSPSPLRGASVGSGSRGTARPAAAANAPSASTPEAISFQGAPALRSRAPAKPAVGASAPRHVGATRLELALSQGEEGHE